MEAVYKGNCCVSSLEIPIHSVLTTVHGQVGLKGKDVVVLGVEKKTTLQLQDPRTVRKVAVLDDHVLMAFAGAHPETNFW